MNLLFHDDWEINGDGTGDPEKLMFDPARRLLDICDHCGIKYTFFAEVMQQFAMKDSNNGQHRRWAEEWENVVKDAIGRGHDVQLHIHPQWIGAEFREGKWTLDYNNWNLAGIEEDVVSELLSKGKRYLEDILCSVRKDYRTVAFRAGGWMCQPSRNIVRGMKNAGIHADCSVVAGKFADYGRLGRVDFREVPSVVEPWEVAENDFSRSGSSGIIEIPTYAEGYCLPLPVHLIAQKPSAALYYLRIFGKWRRKLNKKEFIPEKRMVRKNVKHLECFGKFFSERSLYCSFGYLHWRTILSMVKRRREIEEDRQDVGLMVLLTHSKSFYSFSNFEKLARRLKQMDEIGFQTTQDAVEDIRKKLRES